MSLINALINTPTDIDLRVAIRTEFKKLGINSVIQNMRLNLGEDEKNENLEYQLDIFEEEDNLDSREITDRFVDLDVDVE